MRPRSPASRQPLLASPADPGMSRNQRVSESSISSLMSTDARGQAAMYSSAASPSARSMGPTARLYSDNSHSSRSTPGGSGGMGAVGGGGGAGGFIDDDDDDALHTFTAAEKRDVDSGKKFDITSWRGWANALMLMALLLALVGIFALYPIFSFYIDTNASHGSHTSGYNLGGVNSSGQYPVIPNLPQLIDPDTPEDVMSRTGFDGEQWNLVFSDEFNQEGRTFYPGDDPFWTAVDIHYWPTNDFEWLDPSAVTTEGGHLVITMNQQPINDLNLISGMIQSWNQLCFNKNAYFETSVSMPGKTDVGGFWPGVWTMGNLGRAGYGASNEGTWPYTYDSCDVGTLPNQTWPNGTGPDAALTSGGEGTNGVLSYLPGQKLSACTCPGEDHPGPDVSVGRAAPEIDMIEAQIRLSVEHGEVSQSNQLAPFDDGYNFCNTSRCVEIYDPDMTVWNTYKGGEFQQTVSGLSLLPDRIYRDQVTGGRSGEFATLGFEYQAYPQERERGYIHWTSDSKPSWTMYADAVGPNPTTGIGRRIISEEPMYMIINLHASNNFQLVDWAHLTFPNYFRVDYMRVYQRADGSGSIGCDPEDMPTKDYIERHINAYTNPNLTTWAAAGNTFPKNRLMDTC